MKNTLKELIIFVNQQSVEETDPEKKEKLREVVIYLMQLQQSIAFL